MSRFNEQLAKFKISYSTIREIKLLVKSFEDAELIIDRLSEEQADTSKEFRENFEKLIYANLWVYWEYDYDEHAPQFYNCLSNYLDNNYEYDLKYEDVINLIDEIKSMINYYDIHESPSFQIYYLHQLSIFFDKCLDEEMKDKFIKDRSKFDKDYDLVFKKLDEFQLKNKINYNQINLSTYILRDMLGFEYHIEINDEIEDDELKFLFLSDCISRKNIDYEDIIYECLTENEGLDFIKEFLKEEGFKSLDDYDKKFS